MPQFCPVLPCLPTFRLERRKNRRDPTSPGRETTVGILPQNPAFWGSPRQTQRANRMGGVSFDAPRRALSTILGGMCPRGRQNAVAQKPPTMPYVVRPLKFTFLPITRSFLRIFARGLKCLHTLDRCPVTVDPNWPHVPEILNFRTKLKNFF